MMVSDGFSGFLGGLVLVALLVSCFFFHPIEAFEVE